VRRAIVQAIDVKFPQDLTHQKSLKLVNFCHSCWKNKQVDFFWGDTVYGVVTWARTRYDLCVWWDVKPYSANQMIPTWSILVTVVKIQIHFMGINVCEREWQTNSCM